MRQGAGVKITIDITESLREKILAYKDAELSYVEAPVDDQEIYSRERKNFMLKSAAVARDLHLEALLQGALKCQA
jgi:hypothetical protein